MLDFLKKKKCSLFADLMISAVPVAIWGVFLFGGRAAMLMILCGSSCLLLEMPVRFLLQKKRGLSMLSPFAFFTGILAAFMLPVTVPLWLPLLIAVPIVLCRSFSGYFLHRVFNSAVFSVLIAALLFPGYMERYTKPFAYFSAFEIVPSPELVNAYRVVSPLQLLQQPTYYEEGLLSEFFGISSGPIGAVAVLCLVFSFIWLLIRKHARFTAPLAYLLTIGLLSAAVAPDDIEMLSFTGLQLLAGSAVFIAVYAMNDFASAPNPAYRYGRVLFGVFCGGLTVLFRSFGWGIISDYLPVLFGNLMTPVFELVTDPAVLARLGNRFRKKS